MRLKLFYTANIRPNQHRTNCLWEPNKSFVPNMCLHTVHTVFLVLSPHSPPNSFQAGYSRGCSVLSLYGRTACTASNYDSSSLVSFLSNLIQFLTIHHLLLQCLLSAQINWLLYFTGLKSINGHYNGN